MWNTINIFDDFLEEPSVLNSLYDNALNHSRQNSFNSGSLSHTLTNIPALKDSNPEEKIILNLIKLRGSYLFDNLESRIKCVEFWINFEGSGSPVSSFHLDFDEGRLAWESFQLNSSNPECDSVPDEINIIKALPLWACSVCLSPSLKGLGDMLISSSLKTLYSCDMDDSCVRIPHKFNRAVVFEPSFPYRTSGWDRGADSPELLSTFHVNFWDKELTKY